MKISRRRHDDRGEAMVIWCTALALLLLPLGGLSVDLWHGLSVQRQLQAAAEDAAVAGASGVDVAEYRATSCVLLDPVLAEDLARQNLDRQALGSDVTANFTMSPDREQFGVSLEEPVRLALLSLVVGDRDLAVGAIGVSEPKGSLSGPGCPAPTKGPG